MVMLNDLDRFHLVIDVIDRVPGLGGPVAALRQQMADARQAARAYTREHGEDDPAISGWAWPYRPDGTRRGTTVRAGAEDTGDDNVTSSGPDRRRRGRAWRRPDEGPGRQRRVQLGQVAAAVRRRRGRRPARPRRTVRPGRRRGPRRRSTRWSVERAGVDAVGHRVVHGGRALHRGRSVVDDGVRAELEALVDLAPLHQPAVAGRDRRGTRGAAGRAVGRLLRHRVPRDDAAGGGDVRGAGGVAGRASASAGTASTACPTRTSPAARREVLGRAVRRGCGWSAATSAPARRCAPSTPDGRWTPRWASPRWRAW